jgi:predicted lipid-binding transport protein (Tim44 family)
MKYFSFFVYGLLAVSFLAVAIPDAEARRLGGGKSFGSRPAYKTPYQRQAAPAQPGRGQQTTAQQHNAQQRTALANRGGLWGMLGGLALGGLLGALLFGGAFEGLNFLDILLFAGVAYLLYRLFVARQRSTHGSVATADSSHWRATPEPDTTSSSPSWDLDTPEMRRKFGGKAVESGALTPVHEASDADFPPEFDRQAFLQGAERAYRMLQEAWDHRNLESLRELTTDAVFQELQSQLAQRQGQNQTLILSLKADLLEAREVDGQMEAAVLFDAFLREVDADARTRDRGQQVREVWHFIRGLDATQPTWFLDGIQQLEE